MGEPKILNQSVQVQQLAIASYDYVDLADGTGKVKFYLGKDGTDAGATYYLTRDTSSYSSSQGTAALKSYINQSDSPEFKLPPFNKPMDIQGGAVFNCSVYKHTTGANTGYVTITIKKNGSSIVAEQSETLLGATQYATLAVPITIPLTHFEIGDYLSVSIAITSTSGDIDMGTDPINRDYSGGITAALGMFTASNIEIPFKIDI